MRRAIASQPHHVDTHEGRQAIDSEALARQAMTRYLAARNDRAAAALIGGLQDAGASVVLLKGAATRDLLGLPHRTSADVDLLVSPGCVGAE